MQPILWRFEIRSVPLKAVSRDRMAFEEQEDSDADFDGFYSRSIDFIKSKLNKLKNSVSVFKSKHGHFLLITRCKASRV